MQNNISLFWENKPTKHNILHTQGVSSETRKVTITQALRALAQGSSPFVRSKKQVAIIFSKISVPVVNKVSFALQCLGHGSSDLGSQQASLCSLCGDKEPVAS